MSPSLSRRPRAPLQSLIAINFLLLCYLYFAFVFCICICIYICICIHSLLQSLIATNLVLLCKSCLPLEISIHYILHNRFLFVFPPKKESDLICIFNILFIKTLKVSSLKCKAGPKPGFSINDAFCSENAKTLEFKLNFFGCAEIIMVSE